MDIAAICFTKSGYEVIKKIKNSEAFQKNPIDCYIKCSSMKNEVDIPYVNEALSQWAGARFEKREALVFIGAMGIAVRAIAPWVTSKMEDSPVIVIDDMGQYVIPILSGHVGGANEIAIELAGIIGATAIITTSTDIHHKFAVDVFAKKNYLTILNKNGIAKVSSKVLAGEKILMSVPTLSCLSSNTCVSDEIEIKEYEKLKRKGRLEEVDVFIGTYESSFAAWALLLKPKEYVIGIGCKKGKEKSDIEALVCHSLDQAGISSNEIYCFASIDVKKNEPGIVDMAKEWRVDFQTFSSEELQALEGDFEESEFVKEQVGVGNVCERAALAACGNYGTILVHKTAQNGVTVAIAKKKWSLMFDYE